MRTLQILPAVGASIVLAFGLSACGSDDSSSSGGSASVTVGGEAVDVSGKTVACAERDGKVAIGIGSVTTGVGAIGATVTSGDSPEVETVAIAASGGITYGWAKGTGKDATVSKDGKTYTISGQVTGIDLSNPTAPRTKDFEMKVTCP